MADNPRIEDLRRRVQKDPASIAFAQLAEEYRRAGQHQESIDACRTGLARHPGYLSARVTLGRVLIETGQLDEAQQELELVLKSAPENLAAIRGLAEIYHKHGSLEEALAQYKAALAIARNDPDLDQTVADLTRQLAPTRRPDPENGLSFEQMQRELSVHNPPAALTPPVAVAPPTLREAPPPLREAPPPLREVPKPAPAVASPPQPSAVGERVHRAQRTIAALEQWLAAIAVNNAARTQPGA